MRFKDRHDAASRIIPLLAAYQDEDAVVLAVPRGGVPLGIDIAKAYHFPLGLLLIKKIGFPGNPELAIGAVSLEHEVIDPRFDIDQNYIAAEVDKIRASLRERHKKFLGDRPVPAIEGKTVIIVDDGIATGNTMMVGIEMIKRQKPTAIVVAVPVAPQRTVNAMQKLVDDFFCVYIPDEFYGVGEFYDDFSQVTDDEVIRLLKSAG